MYTLGNGFLPSPDHAGGLRYHGMSPSVSKLKHDGYLDAVAVKQTDVFAAAVEFARLETILPAPESAHAIFPVSYTHLAVYKRQTSTKGGMTSSQPFTFAKQRLAKRQPGGGSMGEGTSPSRMMRSFLAAGSTDGMADSSACVYGDSGSAYSAFLGAISIILPRYMTPTRSDTCFTTVSYTHLDVYKRQVS